MLAGSCMLCGLSQLGCISAIYLNILLGRLKNGSMCMPNLWESFSNMDVRN
jgi:hypothetical protein